MIVRDEEVTIPELDTGAFSVLWSEYGSGEYIQWTNRRDSISSFDSWVSRISHDLQAVGTKNVGKNNDGIPATAVVYGEDMYLLRGFSIGDIP